MEMGTAEYKRFSELANDATTAAQYVAVFPPPDLKGIELERLIRTVAWVGGTNQYPKSAALTQKSCRMYCCS